MTTDSLFLFLDERGYPEDGHSTNDGSTQLSQETTPRDAELLKEPAADQTTKESQHQIHDESETTTFHQLACAETCQTSNND